MRRFTFSHPTGAVAELAGVGIGIALAVYGLRLTKLEPTPSNLYGTPNADIGIVLSSLLVARVAYPLAHLYLSTAGFTEPPISFVRIPLTLLIVGMASGTRRGRPLSADTTRFDDMFAPHFQPGAQHA